MDLNLYNSLTRSLEVFVPTDPSLIKLYSCGPTVYNYPHIGNYRAYISTDILKRYLMYKGYSVNHVMNITDVDDKTIRDSQYAKKSLKEFTEFFTVEFLTDRDMLNITPASSYTKATDYIQEMVSIIEILLKKNHAYRGEDGSIYFSIRSDTTYGKLSHIDIATLKENADGRLKKDEYDKENAKDFALWKAWEPADGDVFWETSLGKGRPGWHIECSAMSHAKLSQPIDIHTGGVDLLFPHHENEIAQSECAFGEPFVHYWIHNEHLLVDGKKMSKSLGNFYTLRDLITKGIDPIAFRYWLYSGHYRTKVNFTLESVEGAHTALHKLYLFYRELGDIFGTVQTSYVEKMNQSMNNDLNTPQVLALVWELVKDTAISNQDKKATLREFDHVLGFGLDQQKEDIIPVEVSKLVEEREMARAQKEWSTSDDLRNEIRKHGYDVSDSTTGVKISKI